MKKISALCLSMLLMANLTAVPAVAADYKAPWVIETQGQVAPFNLAVTSTVAEIYSSGTTVSVGASARYPTSYTAKIYVYVERSSNNSSWEIPHMQAAVLEAVVLLASLDQNRSKAVTTIGPKLQ